MNYPEQNKRALATLADYAANWGEVPSAQEAGRQGVKMVAALRLVLAFHRGGPFDALEWFNLQVAAGVEFTKDATTKALCDVIREVLGEQQEQTGRDTRHAMA